MYRCPCYNKNRSDSRLGGFAGMKSNAYKFIVMTAFVLVLCLTAPFISSVAKVHARATHTHDCRDKTHEKNCFGTPECCTQCPYIENTKNRPCEEQEILHETADIFSPLFSLAFVRLDNRRFPYTGLISLQVRLNN